VQFPKATMQEREYYRTHENERKLYKYLSKFFNNVVVYIATSAQYLLFGKSEPAGTDPYQFNGSLQVSTNQNGSAPYLNLVHSRGSVTTPLAVGSGDTIGYVAGTGYYGSNYYAGGTMEFVATENWDSVNRGMGIIFKTTPNGSASLQESGKILPSGEMVGGGTCMYIPDAGGVPAFTPETVSGKVPFVVDEAGGKAYIYSGGSWVALN